MEEISGGWGGFDKSIPIYKMAPDKLGNEMMSFAM